MIFLIEIDYFNCKSGTKETLCLTTGKHFSKDGKAFTPALSVGLEFSEALFSRGSSGGSSSSSIGNIVIPNSSGHFDYLDDCAFAGRQFRSYWAESEDSTESYPFVTGTVKRSEMSMTELTLSVSDVLDTMDIQMQLGVFAGTNLGMGAVGGLEGGEDDIKGQIKPCVFGRCRNIEPSLINAFHLIYACNYDRDGNRKAVDSFWNVYGKGVEYLYEGDVATTELLIDASVSEGHYKSCVSEGTFRLGTVPNGTVTCDVFECSRTESSAGKVIARILDQYPSPEVDLSSLENLHDDFKCPVGIYITTERTLLEVIREILSTVDAWILPDYNGISRVGRISEVLESPKFILTRDEIRELDRVPSSDNSNNIPSYSVKILHTKNWKTLDRSSLALAVPENLQQFFEQEYRISEHTDLEILSTYPTSKPVSYETLFQSPVFAKLRNGDFKAEPRVAEPFDWVLEDLGTLADVFIDVLAGTATITAGTAGAYLKQILSSPDEIYAGEYTLSFNLMVGDAEVLIKDEGVTIYSESAVEGLFSCTVTVTGEVEIWIGCLSGAILISSVQFRESDALGTPEVEATRRFGLRSLPEERYTFKVSHKHAQSIGLGDEITLVFDRFDLHEGKNFLVIGRTVELPSVEIELDVWRIKNAS